MTARRLLALAASVTTAALVGATTSAPATARTGADPGDSRCVPSGPVRVSALPALAAAGCGLTGRTVTDGRVAVVVPPAGMSVAGEGVGRRGEVRGLTVTNTAAGVRAVRTGNTTPDTLAGRATTDRAGSPGACRDRTFHLEHHKWKSALRYKINLGRMPGRLHAKTVVSQIRIANGNMRKGRNTCGRARITAPASHYLGRTSVRPHITTGGPSCGAYDTRNVVGFGDLPGGLLGWTCYWYFGPRMAAADMMLDNGPNLVTKVPSDCIGTYDFEGTVTHEWGHAYGMAHTGPGHANLTMQHLLSPCSTYARTLGLGDWLGMNKMYGHRR
jgi:hypothetical protein